MDLKYCINFGSPRKKFQVKKGKAIPVIGCGGP
jgi:hypothetical protein